MRTFLRGEFGSWRAALALAAGAALALAFPTPGWSGLAWLAPGALLLAGLHVAPARAFRLGYLGGLAFALISLRWLLHIPFPAGAVAGWLALGAYLALYPALWVWSCWRLLPQRPAEWSRAGGKATASPASPAWLEACQRVAHLPWAWRCLWSLGGAAAWVTTEMLQAHLLTGFPWNALGVSQYAQTPLIQAASVTGVPGVSFLVAWTSVALLVSGISLAVRVGEAASARWPATRGAFRAGRGMSQAGGGAFRFRATPLADLGLPFLVLLGVTLWGVQRLVQSQTISPSRELKLALVQPAIPQRLIWDPAESGRRFEQVIKLSRLALAADPDLLVWPEAALPDFSDAHYRALTNLIATHRVWLVFGADDVEPRPGGGQHVYNSAFLFGPDGGYAAVYRKQRLVIFGEYVPLERWLPFLKWLTPIEGSFTPGRAPVTFVLTNPPARLSALICFEDVFARGVRRHAAPGVDFLLNLTNDGWFGQSAAQWQHAVNAVFRAVETGLPLVRCTNNGLTCWVDPHGRLRGILGHPEGSVYEAGFLSVRLPLPAEGAARPLTAYVRHGDRFGWGCAALTGLALGLCLLRRRRAVFAG